MESIKTIWPGSLGTRRYTLGQLTPGGSLSAITADTANEFFNIDVRAAAASITPAYAVKDARGCLQGTASTNNNELCQWLANHPVYLAGEQDTVLMRASFRFDSGAGAIADHGFGLGLFGASGFIPTDNTNETTQVEAMPNNFIGIYRAPVATYNKVTMAAAKNNGTVAAGTAAYKTTTVPTLAVDQWHDFLIRVNRSNAAGYGAIELFYGIDLVNGEPYTFVDRLELTGAFPDYADTPLYPGFGWLGSSTDNLVFQVCNFEWEVHRQVSG